MRGEAAAPSQSEKLLERLTQPAAAAQPAAAMPQPAEAANLRRLEELAQPKESAPLDETPGEAVKAADLEKANEKLSSLLGKPK